MGIELSLNLSERIKALLVTPGKEHLRNNDRRLIASIWWQDLQAAGLDPNKFKELLDLFIAGKLTHTESIRRTRAKIQENEPEIYGSSGTDYNHTVKEPEIREQINVNEIF